MVHQESLLVLDSDHSVNFHWSHQALKDSIINKWIQFDPHEQPFLKQYTTYIYIVKEFSQLKLEAIISLLFGATHEYRPSQATTWHMAW